MKTSNKFIISILIITIIFSIFSGWFTFYQTNKIKQQTNETINQIIALVKDKYPNVSYKDIALILNDKADKNKQNEMLKQYGIDTTTQWAVLKNQTNSYNFALYSSLTMFLLGISLLIVFLVYIINLHKKTKTITHYLSQINKKQYNLDLDSNSEDELSALENEIYKVTVMLKEDSEKSQNDKENLKNSLSDISHQLKTPLTSVMVMLENIIDDPSMPNDVRTDFLNDIRRETNSISFLVQSILVLSKLDANSIVMKKKPENAENIIKECKKNTEVLAEICGVNVKCICQENFEINCDFKWIVQAVTNIVKNCIEHTKAGGYVKIIAENNYLVKKITVCDNGCGIDENDIPHIFDRFYKGKNSNSDSVGIGLALAKTIIEKNNGSIFVESKVNKGSTFTIKFFRI